ncbi:MAG: dihydroxyacetone kinase subunit DhaK [Chloroflexi bacterium]|nr:dihydroxyacetone kinase subunit DhaK [Chloroflexota bacterium]
MKKLINAVDDVVKEQLEGMEMAHGDMLAVNYEPFFVYRKDAPVSGKVAVISGGGSGHEPMHGGFVGMGMLDAACPGAVFTSPTPDQMYEAAKKVNSGAGVLNLVKNYTGDVLNFETAAELAHGDGIPVQNILIDDDASVKDSLYTAGRRGVGTTVIAEKIVGGAAEDGYDLDKLADLARKVNMYGRSMGIALSGASVPGADKPLFELSDEEFEFGIGIHGEPGRVRQAMKSADEITEMMVAAILDDEAYTRTVREWDREKGEWEEKELTDEPFASGQDVILFVNSMGGTPVSELYAVYRKAAMILKDRGFNVVRNLVGPYITSLEMQGASITIVRADEEILKYWDAPVKTPGLRWGG